MLPNIELDSGAAVPVDLDYTPAAAEIVTPMEGNLALAVLTAIPSDPVWSPVEMNMEDTVPGAWSVQSSVAGVVINNGIASVPASATGPKTLFVITELTELPDSMDVSFQLLSGTVDQMLVYVEDGQETQTPKIEQDATGRASGTLDLSGLGAGPYSVYVVMTRTVNVPVSFRAPLDYVQQPVTLSAAMRQGQIAGTRAAREDNTIFTGLLPDGITLFPLDPARYGHGTAGQRVGLLEFTGAGAPDIRAAIVRWRDPS